ncbi:uncharacterized protein LOC141591213 [Silene latifolia]|uniref:uncharacterized protein LOC141591213 n=1 Tax=Silene latifolia TaxID=37657 RepID=UPI003D776116
MLFRMNLACLPSYLEQAKFSSASILAEVVQAYHAKQYNGHLEEIILERRKMLQELSRFNHDLQFWKSIFKRMIPYQCTRRHVCVVFHEAGKESELEDVAEYVDDGVSFEEYLDDEQSDDDSNTIHIIPYDSEEEDEEESVGDSDEEGSNTIPDDSEEEDEEKSDGDSDEEGSDTIPDDSEEEHENKLD